MNAISGGSLVMVWLLIGVGCHSLEGREVPGEARDAGSGPADAAADVADVDLGPEGDAPGAEDAQGAMDATPQDTSPEDEPLPTDDGGRDGGLPDGVEPRCPEVAVTAPPASLGLDPFYEKYVDAGGIPLVASGQVPDEALRVAYYKIALLLAARPCARQALIRARVRVGIMGRREVTTQLPEYSDLNEAFPGTDWDTRGRGFGATPNRPLSSGAEENLLRGADDRWAGESIFIHEFAHTLFDMGLAELDDGPAWQQRLAMTFELARAEGLWPQTYAISHIKEYWAEGAQGWFDTNLQAEPPNGVHNAVNTRAELREYDPRLAALLGEVFEGSAPTPWCSLEADAPRWDDPTPEDPWATACGFAAPMLEPASCQDEDGARSTGAPGELRVVVINRRTPQALRVFALDPDGQRQELGAVGPRRTAGVLVPQGAPLVVADEEGTCLGFYPAPLAEGRLIIESHWP